MINLNRAFAWWFSATVVAITALNLAPASIWFAVDHIRIADTVEGGQPEMDVSRTIKRPFSANWRVELEREMAPGTFVFQTKATGENRYSTDSKLPDPLTLDWWTYPTLWNLEPGRYRTETCWEIDPPQPFPEKRVCVTSNTFTVTKAKNHDRR